MYVCSRKKTCTHTSTLFPSSSTSPFPSLLSWSLAPHCQCKGRFLFETTLPPHRENLKRSHDSLYRMPAIYSREILGDKGVYRPARADIYTAGELFLSPNNVWARVKGEKISPLLKPALANLICFALLLSDECPRLLCIFIKHHSIRFQLFTLLE